MNKSAESLSLDRRILTALNIAFACAMLLAAEVVHSQSGTIIDDDSGGPGPTDTLTFVDAHSAVIDSAGSTEQRFGVAVCDFNRDGWFDLVVGDHRYPVDPPNSPNDIQIYQGDAQLKFNRLPSNAGHQSDTSGIRRVTSGHSCLDLDNDTFQEIYGPDSDGGDAGRYNNAVTSPGSAITFEPTRGVGCTGAFNRCWTLEADGDASSLERVEDARGSGIGTSTWRGRRIVDWISGSEEHTSVTNHATVYASFPEASSNTHAAFAVVLDFDSNGWADICYPYDGGCYWGSNGSFTWDGSTGLHAPKFNNRNWAAGDFDRDGDFDFFVRAVAPYLSSVPTYLYIFRNDGGRRFTNVTASSGVPLGTGQGGNLWSLGGTGSYANLSVADFNLDGCTDVLMPLERLQTVDPNNRTAIYLSDCDMTFTRESSALDAVVLPSGSDSSKHYLKAVDFDYDGDPDVVGTSDPSRNIGVYRNTTNYSNRRWLNVRVKGPGANHDGLHTILNVWNTSRSTRVSTVQVQEGMQGQLYPNIGLGANAEVDIFVQCPPRSGATGPTGWLDNIASNQHIVVNCSGSSPSWSAYSPGASW